MRKMSIILRTEKNSGAMLDSSGELVAPIVQLLEKSRACLVFSRPLDLQCARHLKPASRTAVLILKNFDNDDRILSFFMFLLY